MAILPLILGYTLDLLLGDPRNFPHPIRAIGKLIVYTETLLRTIFKNNPVMGGAFMPVIVTGLSVLVSIVVLKIAYGIHVFIGIVVETIICYQMLATRCLRDESMKVYRSLVDDDIRSSRKNVSMIVGRDTYNLDSVGITKATVETIAENTSDGTIAPMLYMALFGAVGGIFYKSVNTLDSMIGYKNDLYLYFGRVSARFDDLLNYIPSRISAILVILASAILRLDYKSAFKIWRRDSRNHSSPNSAQTESAYAGALNIQLGGDASYFGKVYNKKTIGDDIRPIKTDDIITSNRILYVTSFIGLIICVGVRWIIC